MSQVILIFLIPFSLLATLALTRWAGLHKERDYLFVFGTIAFLMFFGSLTILVSLSRPPPIPSHLTIHIEPTTVTLGENITISGSLQPKRTGVSVRIRWAEPWATLATVTTDKDGHFSYVWTPEEAGTYKLRTEWLGDKTTSYAISSIVGVTVVEGEIE